MQPETFDWLFRADVLDDVAEYQLAFTACVAGVDDLGNVFAFDEFSQRADASAHFLRRRKLEFRRHDGQLVHVPFVLLFHRGRHSELEEMTDRPRDQVSVVLEVVLAFLEAAKGLGDVAGD